MKNWIGLVLAGCVFCGAGMVTAQGNKTVAPPSLRVVCDPPDAQIRIEGAMPSGDDSVRVDKNPVVLKKGEQYTLVVIKRGYTPYRKSFAAAWSGPKEKSVALEKRIMLVEKGIGPQEGKPWIADLEDSVTMEFMPVPTGHFMMGSDAGEDDERPVHRVEFHRPYWIAKTEVTNQQFEQFKTQEIVLEPNEVIMPRGALYPVTYVTWTEAMDFCAWLTKKERRRGRLPEGYVYALPTEAEWEYACRAGTTEEYAGNVDAMAWHKDNSSTKTSPVGEKKPNAWGLHDMHGNVWEWCVDNWYGSYINAPIDGSQRDDAYNEYEVDLSLIREEGNTIRFYNPDQRVVRGGCWSYSDVACRSANRFYHAPDYQLNYLGFRLVVLWNPPELAPRATSRLNVEVE